MKLEFAMWVALTVGLAIGIFGCSKKTCETIVDEAGEGCGLDYPKDYLEAACLSSYKEDRDCRKELRDLADCLEEEGCTPVECNTEHMDVFDNCGSFARLSTGCEGMNEGDACKVGGRTGGADGICRDDGSKGLNCE